MDGREDLQLNQQFQHDNEVLVKLSIDRIKIDCNTFEREVEKEREKCSLRSACEQQITWKRDDVYSWLVCFACFLVNAVMQGTLGTISMLVPPLVKLYQQIGTNVSAYSFASVPTPTVNSNELVTSQVSFIAGLNYGCIYFFCLAVPPFVERFGCRLMFLTGVLLSLAGCVVPGFWPHASLWVWWLCYGVAYGTGVAILSIVPAVVLEQHFERHFALANAIQWIGSSVGWVAISLARQLVFNYCDSHFAGTEALRLSLSYSMYISASLVCMTIILYPLFASPFNFAARRHLRRQAKSILTSKSSPFSNGSTSTPANHEKLRKNERWRQVKLNLSNILQKFVMFDLPIANLRYGSSKLNTVASKLDESNFRQSMLRVWLELKAVIDPNMIIYIMVGITFQLGSGVPDNHWVLLAEQQFPEHKQFLAAGILVSNGVVQVPSKLLVGWLADKLESVLGQATIYGVGILVKGFSTSFAPPALWLAPHFATVIALNLAYGAGDAVQCTVDIALLQRLVGSERFGRALAITTAAAGVGVLVSPSLGGLAFDLLGDYFLAFALAGILLAASSLLLFFIRPELMATTKMASPLPSQSSTSFVT